MEYVQSSNRDLSIPLWFGILSLVSSCGLGFALKASSIESLVVFACGGAIGILGFILVRQMPVEDKTRGIVKAGKILSIVGAVAGTATCVMWLVENL